MRRNEQTRLLVGLAIPGRGPVAGPAAMPPGAGSLARHCIDARGMLTRVQKWSRRHGLEGSNMACSLGLLVCGILFGLLVGGYVGFIEATTPAVDAPGSFTQLATSDVQWTAMVRRYRAANCSFDSAAENARVSSWQHLIRSATSHSGPDVPDRASSVARGGHFVRLDTPGFRAVKKAVVTR